MEIEVTEVTPEFLMACALHPTTWESWVFPELLQAIMDNIDPTTSFSISCLPNKVWIVADKQFNVLLSTAPVVILPPETKPPEELAANNTTFFQALMDCIKPDPKGPPPKRVA